MKFLPFLFFFTCLPLVSFTEDPQGMVLATEIQGLLTATEKSGATFIRNGKSYSAEEAVEHMQKKYAHFAKKGKIKTAEDFIRLAATKSLMSGKPYTLGLPDGDEQPSAVWLQAQLEQIRKTEKSE